MLLWSHKAEGGLINSFKKNADAVNHGWLLRRMQVLFWSNFSEGVLMNSFEDLADAVIHGMSYCSGRADDYFVEIAGTFVNGEC